MDTLLLIIAIIVIALLVFRPALQPQIIYMPVVTPRQDSSFGCLPLIFVAILVLLALGVIRF